MNGLYPNDGTMAWFLAYRKEFIIIFQLFIFFIFKDIEKQQFINVMINISHKMIMTL